MHIIFIACDIYIQMLFPTTRHVWALFWVLVFSIDTILSAAIGQPVTNVASLMPQKFNHGSRYRRNTRESGEERKGRYWNQRVCEQQKYHFVIIIIMNFLIPLFHCNKFASQLQRRVCNLVGLVAFIMSGCCNVIVIDQI